MTNLAIDAQPDRSQHPATWDAMDGADSYNLEWRLADGEFELGNAVTVTDTSAVITAGYGEWMATLEACNDVGCGDPVASNFTVDRAPDPQQTPIRLVGNTGQNDDGPFTFSMDMAQAFTTGSNADGYRLTSVEVGFRDTLGSPVYTVEIYSNSASDEPGSSLGTLDAPSSLTAAMLNTFATSGIDLDADTTYWLVVDVSTTSIDTALSATNADGQGRGAGLEHCRHKQLSERK